MQFEQRSMGAEYNCIRAGKCSIVQGNSICLEINKFRSMEMPKDWKVILALCFLL